MLGIVYNNRNNTHDRVLVADRPGSARQAIGADQFTRYLLVMGGTTLDSNTVGLGAGLPFDNSLDITWNGQTIKYLRLRLGGQGLAPGKYRARLVVFDASNPNGLVWDVLAIKVVD